MNYHSCPCPTDPVPYNPCCPDTTELASAITATDKDCNPRRIIPNGSGVLAAKGNKAGMMDGSAEKPLKMNFESFFSADGYVLLQDPGGRIIAIKPNTDLDAPNAVLQFVYQDGAFKLVPITHENLFMDGDVVSSAKGIMAMIACGGPTGSVKLGKFIPFPQAPAGGPWQVLVDGNNNVYASKIAIDQCPATDSVDKLNTLLGCVDGKYKTIIPVKDKTLIGIEEAGAVKWGLKDNTSNITSVARTSIYSKTYNTADAGALTSDTIDIKTLIGYNENFTFAMLHFSYRAQTSTSDMTHDVAVDGRKYVGINLIAQSFGGENNHNSAFVPIPTSKNWVITNTRSVWQPGSAAGNHWIEVSLDGWVK